ncbi:MAG: hypothetical protein ACOC5L_04035 [Halobacteriota archaeon]
MGFEPQILCHAKASGINLNVAPTVGLDIYKRFLDKFLAKKKGKISKEMVS